MIILTFTRESGVKRLYPIYELLFKEQRKENCGLRWIWRVLYDVDEKKKDVENITKLIDRNGLL